MSAGFDFKNEVFWGTNGSVEAYVEALGKIAARRLGPEDPLTLFFRGELEGFFSGKVVFLDECLGDAEVCRRFVQILDEATAELLQGNTLSDLGRNWAATVMGQLRQKVIRSLEEGETPTGSTKNQHREVKERYGAFFDDVSRVLFEADPIGINFSSNTDEYDPEAGTIIPRLASAASAQDVTSIVYQEFCRWFDEESVGPAENYQQIGETLWSLWQQFKSNAT